MITCRHCRQNFRKSVDEIGARCPKCKRPLFERPPRRGKTVETGTCALHPASPGVGACRICASTMCATCRTRWDDVPVCPTCFNKAMERGDPSPFEQRARDRRAVAGLIFALAGWGILICTLAPLRQLTMGHPGVGSVYWVAFLFLVAFLPALLAISQSAEVIRRRGARLSYATAVLCLAGAQLGVMFAVMCVNVLGN